MAAAFALMLSFLGEYLSARDMAGAFAAYVTGNVASNLFGRLIAAFLVDHYGLAHYFLVFAALNLAGGVLAALWLDRALRMSSVDAVTTSPMASWSAHRRSPPSESVFACCSPSSAHSLT